jgi:hypothetical protein
MGNQSGTFDIAQVQLEPGTRATTFEYRHIQQELALCQRYYYRTGGDLKMLGMGYTTTAAAGVISGSFPVPMRVAPTAIETTGTSSDYLGYNKGAGAPLSTGPTFNTTGNTDRWVITLTAPASSFEAGGGLGLYTKTGTTAYLGWSAEL